jgi:flavin reductase (DIM6/NTAB) family NADH-FMN oxidoreductase RutF
LLVVQHWDVLTLSEMTNMPDFSKLQGAEALKATFRRHASGVAIVTSSNAAGEPIGFTATSVTSLGSNPPLVTFNIAQGSSSYPHLTVGKLVAIHTLGPSNLELAQLMAGPKELRFKEAYQVGPENTPLFTDATAVLLARVRAKHEVENNAVVVLDAIEAFESNPAEPLLYFQRGYLTTGQRLADNY